MQVSRLATECTTLPEYVIINRNEVPYEEFVGPERPYVRREVTRLGSEKSTQERTRLKAIFINTNKY